MANYSPKLENNLLDWLAKFNKKNLRPPKILHIGNIANNAYLNAKVLNEAGFDCDVLCYDYYHIMSCPEWESVNFDSKEMDALNPDWCKVDLENFSRPMWFAQGPMNICIQYLIAKRNGSSLLAQFLWRVLSINNKILPCTSLNSFINRITNQNKYFLKVIEALNFTKSNSSYSWPPKIFKKLEHTYKKNFSNRIDKFCIEDLDPYKKITPKLRKLFKYYDVVIGYATDPILPMLASDAPYIAYEHGTVRNIPYETNTQGRLTSLAYAGAATIIMTNADSIDHALKLQPDSNKIIFGLHGYDERMILGRLPKNKKTRMQIRYNISDNIKLFFAPARHHWKTGYDTWLKANNLIIEATRILAQSHKDLFRIIFVNWGQEVNLSKELIAKYQIDDLFLWVDPLPKFDLTATYAHVDGVIDQFVLPCLGGISIEAMTVGKVPVITALDDDAMKRFYGETVPLFNCKTADEIASAMKTIIDSQAITNEKVAQCSRWMAKYHSHKNLIQTHAAAYEIALRNSL